MSYNVALTSYKELNVLLYNDFFVLFHVIIEF